MDNRIVKKKLHPFTMVENSLINDRKLTIGARFLIIYFLSKPDGWQIRSKDVERTCSISPHIRRKLMKELEKHGYAWIEQARSPDGKLLGSRWVITDEPLDNRDSNLLNPGEPTEITIFPTSDQTEARPIATYSNTDSSSNNDLTKKYGDLPIEELQVLDAIQKCKSYFEEWSGFRDTIMANNAIDLKTFYAELEGWVRHKSDQPAVISNPTKYIPKSFEPWIKRSKTFTKQLTNKVPAMGSSYDGDASKLQ